MVGARSVELTSAGKDLGKLNFYNSLDVPTSIVGDVGVQPKQQSPDPQVTNRILNNHMMILDSATPMFTSEFTIIAP